MSYGPEWGQPDGDHWRQLREDCEDAVTAWKTRRIVFQKASKRLQAAQAIKKKADKMKATKTAMARLDHEWSRWTSATATLAVAVELEGLDATPVLLFKRALRLYRVADRANEVDAALTTVDVLIERIEYRKIAENAKTLGIEAAMKEPDKRDADKAARRAEFSRLMREDSKFRAMRHGERAKRLGVSESTVQRDFGSWKEDQDSHRGS